MMILLLVLPGACVHDEPTAHLNDGPRPKPGMEKLKKNKNLVFTVSEGMGMFFNVSANTFVDDTP